MSVTLQHIIDLYRVRRQDKRKYKSETNVPGVRIPGQVNLPDAKIIIYRLNIKR